MLFTKKRPDGTYVKDLHFFTRMLPFLMPTRADACIYFEQEIDLTRTLQYVRSKRGEAKPTVFYIILYAALRTLAVRPKMNRFVSGGRHYQRNRIRFNFVAKRDMTDDGEEVNVTMSFSPRLTLEQFCEKIHGYVSAVKEGTEAGSEKINSLITLLPPFCIRFLVRAAMFLDNHNALPAPVIDSLPFYSTIFFTNVGSVGIDAPFHHNFEIGNCGIFCAIGRVRKERSLGPGGTVETKDKIKLTFTYDDRITDGIYCARSLDMMRKLVENPEQLEIPQELTPEQTAALGLAGKEM